MSTSKIPKEARLAFTRSFENLPSVGLTGGGQAIESVVKLFLETLQEVDPDTQFTSAHVNMWLGEYMKNLPEKERFPVGGINNYGLGKFLKKNIDGALGYTQTGSYGNRAIYGLITENGD